jgi:hypothetical protein
MLKITAKMTTLLTIMIQVASAKVVSASGSIRSVPR